MTNAASGKNCTITIGTPTDSAIEWSDYCYTLVDITDATEVLHAATADPTHAVITLCTSTYVTGGQIIKVQSSTPWAATTQLEDNHQY